MVRVGVKAQKTILINHCLRVGKTDNVKRQHMRIGSFICFLHDLLNISIFQACKRRRLV